MNRPNTFIIGAPKCGTSSLAKYLAGHPGVFFCTPKEPFYWCRDFWRAKHELNLKSLDDYLALFARADRARHKVIAEGSTRYLRSDVAISGILEFDPDARFIVMLRNPVELVQAFHMEQCYSLQENVRSFETAWRLQTERAEGRCLPKHCASPEFLQYGRVAALGEQLDRAKRIIPEGQLKVILFDDFKQDTGAVYRDVLAFLGLPDDRRTEFPVVNSAHVHRFEWLAKLILTPPGVFEKPVLRLRRHLWENRYPPVEWVKARLNRGKARENLPAGLRAELQACFRPDVEKLGRLLNRDLSHWVKD